MHTSSSFHPHTHTHACTLIPAEDRKPAGLKVYTNSAEGKGGGGGIILTTECYSKGGGRGMICTTQCDNMGGVGISYVPHKQCRRQGWG